MEPIRIFGKAALHPAVAGFAAAGGTNNTRNYTPSGAFTLTTWYRRTVTSSACSDISPAIQITVLPAIANNTVAAVQTICNGQTPAGINRHTSNRR